MLSHVIRYWRAETVVFLGLWLTLMIAGRSGFFKDPGSLWHIVVGQRMLASGELIYADSFSFTAFGPSCSIQAAHESNRCGSTRP
jgi:hypothetical protein